MAGFGDVLIWLIGAFSIATMIWVVYRAFVTPESSEEPVLAEALASLTPIERWLWRDVVRRNLAKPGTRLSRMIPKYGLRAATQSVIGSVWMIPGLLVIASIPFLQDHRLGKAGEVIGGVFVGIAIVSFMFAFWRVVGSVRAGRRYRNGRHDVSQRANGGFRHLPTGRKICAATVAAILIIFVSAVLVAVFRGDLSSYRGTVVKYFDAYLHDDPVGMQRELCSGALARLGRDPMKWTDLLARERERLATFTAFDVLRGEPRRAFIALQMDHGPQPVVTLGIVRQNGHFLVCPGDDHLLGEPAGTL